MTFLTRDGVDCVGGIGEEKHGRGLGNLLGVFIERLLGLQDQRPGARAPPSHRDAPRSKEAGARWKSSDRRP
jgi:hypothetical protein